MRSSTLYRVLVLIAVALTGNQVGTLHHIDLAPAAVLVVGVIAGFFIGIVAAIVGVAGGELFIPTIVLLFGTDIKVAGSRSLAVSLPTMLVAFARDSRDGSFLVLSRHARLTVVPWPLASSRADERRVEPLTVPAETADAEASAGRWPAVVASQAR